MRVSVNKAKAERITREQTKRWKLRKMKGEKEKVLELER